MKNTRAMIVSLAYLLPISILLISIIWTLDIQSTSLTGISFESVLYVTALLASVATFWLLAPGALFVFCLILDCVFTVRNKVRGRHKFDTIVLQKK